MIGFDSTGQGFIDFDSLDKLGIDELLEVFNGAVAERKRLSMERQGELVKNGCTPRYWVLDAEFKFSQYLEQVVYERYREDLERSVRG